MISVLPKELYLTKDLIRNVYVHLPFCQKKCHFCAFPVHAVGTHDSQYSSQLMKNYMVHLEKQINFAKSHSLLDSPLKSLYFGGGTPSLYKVDQLTKLLSLFNVNNQTQATIEINPSQLRILPELIKTKINRWSFGIQTFNRQILQKMNRQQSLFEELVKGLGLYRPRKISIDFILDFNVEQKDFGTMLKFFEDVLPQHVTIYMLQTNEGSQLFKNRSRFQWLPKDEILVQRYIQTSNYLTKLGFEHYEVCNFALGQTNKSIHSSVYWQGDKEYLAFGMGATSLNNELRVTKPKTIKRFEKFVRSLQQNEVLNLQQLGFQINIEREWKTKLQSVIMSGLRKKTGVPWQKIKGICGNKFYFVEKTILQQLSKIDESKSGLINWTTIKTSISLNVPQGFLFADEIIFRIIQTLNKHSL